MYMYTYMRTYIVHVHGAICTHVCLPAQDQLGGYYCDCVAGYYGENCETEHDECAAQPCFHGNCVVCVAYLYSGATCI